MKKTAKVLGLMLALIMVMALLPSMAFADGECTHSSTHVIYKWSETNPTDCWAALICDDPAHTGNKEIAAQHDVAPVVTVHPATCTADKYTTYSFTFTDWAVPQTFTVTETGTAFGHNWGETHYVRDNEAGTYTATRVCKNDPSHVETVTTSCKYEFKAPDCVNAGYEKISYVPFTVDWAFAADSEVIIPPLGHEIGADGKFFATGDVYHHYQYCNRCKQYVNPQDHVWGEWQVTKEPTEKEKGEAIVFCQVCGGSMTCEIPARTPQTGDDSMLALWIGMFLLSGGAVSVLAARKRKEH